MKGNTTNNQLLMKPKDQEPRTAKVGSFTVTIVGILLEVRSTQGKHQGLWVRDTSSTSNNPLPSMHTSNKLHILQHQTTSTSLGERTRAWPGP